MAFIVKEVPDDDSVFIDERVELVCRFAGKDGGIETVGFVNDPSSMEPIAAMQYKATSALAQLTQIMLMIADCDEKTISDMGALPGGLTMQKFNYAEISLGKGEKRR